MLVSETFTAGYGHHEYDDYRGGYERHGRDHADYRRYRYGGWEPNRYCHCDYWKGR